MIYWDDGKDIVDMASSLGIKAYQFTTTEKFLSEVKTELEL